MVSLELYRWTGKEKKKKDKTGIQISTYIQKSNTFIFTSFSQPLWITHSGLLKRVKIITLD